MGRAHRGTIEEVDVGVVEEAVVDVVEEASEEGFSGAERQGGISGSPRCCQRGGGSREP